MAAITDLAAVANATAAGYALIQYVNSQGRRIARFEKNLKGENGTTGALSAVCGVGDDATNATTARTNALAALNANRRHRYAGAPAVPQARAAWTRGPTLRPPSRRRTRTDDAPDTSHRGRMARDGVEPECEAVLCGEVARAARCDLNRAPRGGGVSGRASSQARPPRVAAFQRPRACHLPGRLARDRRGAFCVASSRHRPRIAPGSERPPPRRSRRPSRQPRRQQLHRSRQSTPRSTRRRQPSRSSSSASGTILRLFPTRSAPSSAPMRTNSKTARWMASSHRSRPNN
jgi:hypothetical protein